MCNILHIFFYENITSNMDKQVVYIVTQYGCNSSPSDMWIPNNKIFTNYDDAYAYFLKVSPSLDDIWNEAEQYVNTKYKNEDLTNDYVIIENRVQTSGYHSGERGNYAKRPAGAVIARSIIKK